MTTDGPTSGFPSAARTTDSEFDTVVIGGGITGMCVSWFLAQEGAAVVCVDDGGNAGSGANAGSLHVQMQSRVLRLFPQRMPDYEKTVAIYPRAVDFWQRLAAELGEDIDLRIGGGLMIAQSDAEVRLLQRKCAAETRNGVDSAFIGASELLSIAPYLHSGVRGAVYCAAEGQLNPLLANAVIRRRLRRSGAQLRERETVLRIDRDARAYRVILAGGEIRAGRVVIAAGAGSGPIAATLGLRLPTRAEPLHMNVTEATTPFLDGLLQHAAQPITVKQLHSGQVLVGGGWPARASGAAPVPEILRASLTGNLRLAQALVPRLAGLQVLRCWAGVNPTIDLLSVLGEVTSLPGVFIAVPGDAGYTLGPYCARLLVDSMYGRRPDFPLENFSPMRFGDRP
ncbi:MAG: FAD-binding oxidoreductase [Gammaproteobacteria bacterium]|nr:FAD-binding oxidoreductase [Gammaproteobacteria bacterium]